MNKFTDEQRTEIREIVREEINRSAWCSLYARYPADFVQGLERELQKQFPYLKFDSPEWKTVLDSPAASSPNQ